MYLTNESKQAGVKLRSQSVSQSVNLCHLVGHSMSHLLGQYVIQSICPFFSQRSSYSVGKSVIQFAGRNRSDLVSFLKKPIDVTGALALAL